MKKWQVLIIVNFLLSALCPSRVAAQVVVDFGECIRDGMDLAFRHSTLGCSSKSSACIRMDSEYMLYIKYYSIEYCIEETIFFDKVFPYYKSVCQGGNIDVATISASPYTILNSESTTTIGGGFMDRSSSIMVNEATTSAGLTTLVTAPTITPSASIGVTNITTQAVAKSSTSDRSLMSTDQVTKDLNENDQPSPVANHDADLSRAAKAGIGVGSVIGAAFLVIVGIVVHRLWARFVPARTGTDLVDDKSSRIESSIMQTPSMAPVELPSPTRLSEM